LLETLLFRIVGREQKLGLDERAVTITPMEQSQHPGRRAI